MRKHKEHVMEELAELRGRIRELEKSEAERKQAEDKLQKYREHLEELVEERTAEMKKANEELQQHIAERKQAEKALRESEERLKLAVEGADLGLWDHNMKAGTVVRNRRWAEMLGYTQEEVNADAQTWKNLIHPDDVPKVHKIAQDHEAGRTPFFKVEHRMKTKTGEWKWILNWGKIIERDKGGQPVRATGMHLDITELKEAEAAREKLILELREALAKIKTLSGLLPICSSCKRIRDDEGYWQQVEVYLLSHSHAEFSHGICPDCMKKLYPEFQKADE